MAAERDREDAAEAREEWFEGELHLDPEKIVFIDETSVSTLRPGAARGAFPASVPFGHWETTTLIAALRVDAPIMADGALDGPSFLAYVE